MKAAYESNQGVKLLKLSSLDASIFATNIAQPRPQAKPASIQYIKRKAVAGVFEAARLT